eukprot:TRINITY_DN1986_c0_g1_i1.p1 TRINITY_DN1986_c0_g1~~TRINITY_DN1986_c0_g1_i1.p1  ORF type:complete len:135 (-),score=33.61 TRINITY_DN1986_c0_g1_i1:2-406(-)
MTQTLSPVLGRLQAKKESLRKGSLLILRHLVNSLDEELKGSRPLIISNCQVLMNEPSYDVRKTFVQLITGMADKGYLALEGGEKMIEFLVKQASISEKEIRRFDAEQKAAGGGKKKKKYRLRGRSSETAKAHRG